MNVDVVTIGESMVLFQPLQDGPLSYAPFFTRTIAGAESNVAIGLTRLGKRVRWISRVGRDPFGDVIVRTLAGEGVDVDFVDRDDSAPTAIYFKEFKGYGDPNVYYYRRGSAVSRLAPEHVSPDWFAGASLLHVTGITPALGDGPAEAVVSSMKMARDMGLMVSFDPNLRRKLWDDATARRTLLALVPLCDIFLPGLAEAEFLLGSRPIEEMGEAFLSMGARVVAIKLGHRGAVAVTRRGMVSVSPRKVDQVVDTIGAGDAFAAGFLSVCLDHDRTRLESPDVVQEALERGNLLGSLAVQYRGDWEGLPTWQEYVRLADGQGVVAR